MAEACGLEFRGLFSETRGRTSNVATPGSVMPRRSTTRSQAREGYDAEQIERAAAATGAAIRPAGRTAAVTRAGWCGETCAHGGTGVHGERAGRLRSAACTGPPREGAAGRRIRRQREEGTARDGIDAGGRAAEQTVTRGDHPLPGARHGHRHAQLGREI